MKGLLERAVNLLRKKPPQTFRYEQYAKDLDGQPIFQWIDDKGNWIEDDYRGSTLPKNAIREYSDRAYEYQKLQLESGNQTPWVKRGQTK